MKMIFERLRKYDLKLNPNKCMFGATSDKLLGFVAIQSGLEIDQLKIKAIIVMSALRIEKRGLRFCFNTSVALLPDCQILASHYSNCLKWMQDVLEWRLLNRFWENYGIYDESSRLGIVSAWRPFADIWQSMISQWVACLTNMMKLAKGNMRFINWARIHRWRISIFHHPRENMLCVRVGHPEAASLNVVSYYIVDFMYGSNKILLRKPMLSGGSHDSICSVWHHLHNIAIYERASNYCSYSRKYD